MEQKELKDHPTISEFTRIMKKVYDKGRNEADLTLDKLMEELKIDLKNMTIE